MLRAEVEDAVRQRTWLDRQRYRAQQWSSYQRWTTYDRMAGQRWYGFQRVRDLEGLPPEIVLVPLAIPTEPSGEQHHLIRQGQQRFRIREFVMANPFLAAPSSVSTSPRIGAPRSRPVSRPARPRARGGRAAAAGAARARRYDPQHDFAGAAGRPRREHDGHQAGREAGGARDGRHRPPTRPRARLFELSPERTARLSREIGQATRTNLEKRQREALLREQLQTIRPRARRGRGDGSRGRGPAQGDR